MSQYPLGIRMKENTIKNLTILCITTTVSRIEGSDLSQSLKRVISPLWAQSLKKMTVKHY